jgi:DNA-binding transcriptional LysR family regulator
MQSNIESLTSGVSVFAAIVDTGSFAAAAERLGISPSGVSRAIARLERRLKVRLLSRTTRSLTLTGEGRRFYDSVVPHLEGIEEAVAAIVGDSASVRGRLRVNLDPVFSRVVLGKQLHEFMDAYPDLAIEFTARDQLGDLVADGFDLALRFGKPQASSLVARKLLDTAVVTVAAPGYVARFGRLAIVISEQTHALQFPFWPATQPGHAGEQARRRRRLTPSLLLLCPRQQ